MYLVLCPECKEPVLQHEMEEHRQGGHQQVGRQIGGWRWRGRVLSAAHLMAACHGQVAQPLRLAPYAKWKR